MKKHGAFWETDGHGFTFYWMGEEVKADDFNQRLADMTKSIGEEIDMFVRGFEARKALNEGQKTVAQLDELEKIAKLPLCKDCRKLIGEMPQ